MYSHFTQAERQHLTLLTRQCISDESHTVQKHGAFSITPKKKGSLTALPFPATARIMGISERTVKFHFSNIYAKLNVVKRPRPWPWVFLAGSSEP